ncbi:MAG: branched-chain amino acid ABC transporter substrate-binding protein [Rhodovulum sulfidophilum]|uniref:Branched-chain amino acid ABC transporter substrate-binding protein n=1 Tax=Rhodovulum sulfidophilum TaxID=35806 RepID=A0A2W5MYU6_RHOSU|nr:MAG: branched-chain amino acid ABC transporter substrate-binding protein [Rhodovulum sulfidophilum]
MRGIWTAGLLGGGLIAFAAGAAWAQDPLRIGGVVSVSGGGASIGRVTMLGWEMAVEEINADGGIAGRPVELVIADSQTDPTHAVGEARRLTENEGIAAMVGPVTSQEAIPVTGVTTAANIAQVSTAAASDLTPGAAPYHFSNTPTGLDQMIPAIRYAREELGLTKIALMSDNGGMSKAAVAEITAYMTEQGDPPVATQEFSFRAEDMTPQLFSLRQSGAEAVLLINSIGDDSRKFFQNRDEIGWSVPVIGSLTTSNYAAGNAEVLGEEAFEDVYGVQFVGMTYCPGDPVGESDFARFASRAGERVPNLEQLGGAAALAPYYVEPYILKAAIEGAGSTEGAVVAGWIEANAAAMPNMLGEFTASKDSHFLLSDKAIVVVKAPHVHREDGLAERAVCP